MESVMKPVVPPVMEAPDEHGAKECNPAIVIPRIIRVSAIGGSVIGISIIWVSTIGGPGVGVSGIRVFIIGVGIPRSTRIISSGVGITGSPGIVSGGVGIAGSPRITGGVGIVVVGRSGNFGAS
ncbi:hypothetical protein [Cupriavidus sp. IDO]|uniref:hypothetical protein n=1 Tax=Cupriavidus sp. IDO TaxID=1539142 RepID=UPI001269B868|nr:hypothetical protein [Cupriavidus sp. IDO]